MSKCALCKTSLKDDEINVCDKCRLDFLNFKRQLAEKDKEINELRFEKRNIFGLIEQMEVKVAGVTKEKIQEIRKQVCDEIREGLLKKLEYKNDTYLYREQEAYRDGINSAISIIHKIEKGESDEENGKD